VNGPEDLPFEWDAVDWRSSEDEVRRLRQRIFKDGECRDRELRPDRGTTRCRPTVTVSSHSRVLDRATHDIQLNRVSYTYPGADRPALHDLSFAVRRGQLVLITGANGAGKSTITKLLLRFADPSASVIRLDGNDVRALTVESLREQVTPLLQQTQVFHGTVIDNVAFGRPGATEAEIVAAATDADENDFISALPHGYHTMLDGAGQRHLAMSRRWRHRGIRIASGTSKPSTAWALGFWCMPRRS
jgi:ABC-type multidrug transport system fused ATPase/permease subunit